MKVILASIVSILLGLSNCEDSSDRVLDFYKGTKAYTLAKAVANGDTEEIEELTKEDSSLLRYNNPKSGTNVLFLAVYKKQYGSLKKLLELGGDANSIDYLSKYSLLIKVIESFSSKYDWEEGKKYLDLLFEYKANPNYIVNDFVSNKGISYIGKSPISEASQTHLELFKYLLSKNADHKIRVDNELPFGNALFSNKIEIIDYYIDSLKVNVKDPIYIREDDSLYIQDYIDKYMNYIEGTEGDKKKQKLIKKLESMGVDFKNYEYKLR
jgi:hypothetical protein